MLPESPGLSRLTKRKKKMEDVGRAGVGGVEQETAAAASTTSSGNVRRTDDEQKRVLALREEEDAGVVEGPWHQEEEEQGGPAWNVGFPAVLAHGGVSQEGGGEQDEDSVKVVVRVRPPLHRETHGFHSYAPATAVDSTGKMLTLSENIDAVENGGVENGVVYNTYRFAFDRVYGPESQQTQVYNDSARDVVANVLQGYNASIIAYGQTGAGKTHTMTGSLSGEDRGIIPRAVDDVFAHISHDTGQCKYLVRASYLQIYNEVVSDLLKPENTNLMIREDKRRGVHVEGLSEWVVRTPSDVYDLMSRGGNARTTGATRLNEISSRSHAIFILVVEKSYVDNEQGRPLMRLHSEVDAATVGSSGAVAEAVAAVAAAGKSIKRTVRMGKLNLVDLAGSERVHLTGAKGQRLEESKKINQSLSALGNVIGALTDPKRSDAKSHVPYRDSKLTRILEDSLGGNCKTTFVAVISPAVEFFSESLSTLKFAHRAKRVKNAPRVNEDDNQRTLLKKYERELKKLRAELEKRSKDLVDRRLLLQLEEARRKEQADKMAAISALERQSAEIARQKAAMSSLQRRISSMQSQLLVGGQGVEDTPAFRSLLAREQSKIREEYEKRLSELEFERRSVAEDKAATERLKGLLLKQRDVMVALTKRLGERDKEVLGLQEKLDEREKKLKDTEDALDKRTAQLIAMRKRFASIASQKSPRGQTDLTEVSYNVNTSDDGEFMDDAVDQKGGPMEVTAELSSSQIDTEDEESIKGDIENPSPVKQDRIKAIENQNSPRLEWVTEREALKTILELKVLKLLDEVESSMGASGIETSDPGKVLRQIGHLKKLVSATVTAMEVPPM